MTVGGWIIFIILPVFVFLISIMLILDVCYSRLSKIIAGVVSVAVVVGLYFGMSWYFGNTASGQRAMVDQKSDFSNGIERTITIFTADGEIIAQYSGKIDIEGNDGGYILFDFEGKRYTYFNCFVESIANLN